MKKIFLMMAAGLALFASCDTGGETEEDLGAILAAYAYNSNVRQFTANLDPFHVAFLLNTLMVEADLLGVDVNDASLSTTRTTLFGSAIGISYDDQGVYTLLLSGKGEYDYLRNGTIKIKTYGTTLSSGNTWDVLIPKEDAYTVSIDGVLTKIYSEAYSIACTQDNTWRISLTHFVSNMPEAAEYELFSDWSGTMTMVQDQFPGDQSLASVSTSGYSLSVNSDSQIQTMYISDLMQVTVPSSTPLKFSPACPLNRILEGGMSTHFTDSELVTDPYAIATAVWTESTTDCVANVELKYLGTIYQ